MLLGAFANFTCLLAYIATQPLTDWTVLVDAPARIEPGTYALPPSLHLEAFPTTTGFPGLVADGVMFTGVSALSFRNFEAVLIKNADRALLNASDVVTVQIDSCNFLGGGFPVFHAAAGGSLRLILTGTAVLNLGGPIVSLAPNSSAIVFARDQSCVMPGAVQASPQARLVFFVADSVSLSPSYSATLLSQASQVAFRPAAPEHWSFQPLTVAEALDAVARELAALQHEKSPWRVRVRSRFLKRV